MLFLFCFQLYAQKSLDVGIHSCIYLEDSEKERGVSAEIQLLFDSTFVITGATMYLNKIVSGKSLQIISLVTDNYEKIKELHLNDESFKIEDSKTLRFEKSEGAVYKITKGDVYFVRAILSEPSFGSSIIVDFPVEDNLMLGKMYENDEYMTR